MDTEIWIAAPFHVLQNVILFFPPLLFKNVKAILSLWTVPELPAGWIWPLGTACHALGCLLLPC